MYISNLYFIVDKIFKFKVQDKIIDPGFDSLFVSDNLFHGSVSQNVWSA